MNHDTNGRELNKMKPGAMPSLALLVLGGCMAACGPPVGSATRAFDFRDNVWRALPDVAPLPPTDGSAPVDSFHARHVGEIVFTGRDLERDTPLVEADVRREFEFGPRISMRAFFRETIESSMRRAGITCHTEASVALGPASPVPDTPQDWGTGPVSFVAMRWTSPAPLYGIGTLVLTRKTWQDDSSRLSLWANVFLSTLREGRNEVALVLRAFCDGEREGAEGTFGTIVARGSFHLDLAPGAVARYRAKFGPMLPANLHPEMASSVAQALSQQGMTNTMLVFPEYWELSGGEHHTPWKRRTDVLAVHRRDRYCDVLFGGVSQDADNPRSTNWAEETTSVSFIEKPDLVIPCDVLREALR
jgi:hypothetical protein